MDTNIKMNIKYINVTDLSKIYTNNNNFNYTVIVFL